MKPSRNGFLEINIPNHTGELTRVRCYQHIANVDTNQHLLLLHGNPGQISDWLPLVPYLTQSAHVTTFDFPGFGHSQPVDPDDNQALRLSSMAKIGFEVIKALQLNQPLWIVGHSHGGGVAQVMGAQYQDLINGLILIGSISGSPHLSYKIMAREPIQSIFKNNHYIPNFLLKKLISSVATFLFAPDKLPEIVTKEQRNLLCKRRDIISNMAQLAKLSPDSQIRPQIKQITKPTLVIHGNRDAVVPPNHGQWIYQTLKSQQVNTVMQTMEGEGHMTMYTKPKYIYRIIEPWIRTTAAL